MLTGRPVAGVCSVSRVGALAFLLRQRNRKRLAGTSDLVYEAQLRPVRSGDSDQDSLAPTRSFVW